MTVENHYNEEYFAYQNRAADLQGQANLFKFIPYVRDTDKVLDFGCGSGALLRAIGEREGGTIGVELNSTARQYAAENGTMTVASLAEIESESIDLVVSNHALEHVTEPFQIMSELFSVFRPSGRIVIVVPCDRVWRKFCVDDINFHLYSWSAGNLGNLAKAVGFEVKDAREIPHLWPPYWKFIIEKLGWPKFHTLSKVYARLRRTVSQVRVVAVRPE